LTSAGQGLTRRHLRRLVLLMGAGVLFFVGLFLCLHLLLIYAGAAPDPSVYNFYPLMAGLGALFGFERWWAHEQGGVNPFHDR
jgi:drug/metabolite transporter (DMT)-like permease